MRPMFVLLSLTDKKCIIKSDLQKGVVELRAM